MRHQVTLALAAALVACGPTVQQVPVTEAPPPQEEPVFEPVGSYDFSTDVQGNVVRGVLHIRRGEEGLTGSLVTDVTGELRFSQVTFAGQRGDLRARTDQGDLVMRIEFQDRDRFTGGWELTTGIGGTLSGQRRP